MSHEEMGIFSLLRNPVRTAYQPAVTEDWNLDEIEQISHGYCRAGKIYEFYWGGGDTHPSDVVWLGVFDLVVSPKVLDVLSEFTGWSTYPVRIFDGRGENVPGYAGLVINGRSGQMDSDLTHVERAKGRDWLNYVGLVFEFDTWDGSDLFYPVRGPGPVVTANLAEKLQRAGVTNMSLELLPEVRMQKRMVDELLERRRRMEGYPQKDNL